MTLLYTTECNRLSSGQSVDHERPCIGSVSDLLLAATLTLTHQIVVDVWHCKDTDTCLHHRLDYCNGLLHGDSSACWRNYKPFRMPTITPVLHKLHWLPVCRVQARDDLQVYKFLHSLAPTYLADDCLAISTIAGKWHLQSAGTRLLTVPRTKTMLRTTSFVVAGLVIWNSLPTAVWSATLSPLTSARHLKAHLFGWMIARLRIIYHALYKSTHHHHHHQWSQCYYK